MNVNTSTTRLDSIDDPSDADLMSVQHVDIDVTDWESILEPVITVKVVDEDFWAEDENVHDDRWDSGVPSWSAWA